MHEEVHNLIQARAVHKMHDTGSAIAVRCRAARMLPLASSAPRCRLRDELLGRSAELLVVRRGPLRHGDAHQVLLLHRQLIELALQLDL